MASISELYTVAPLTDAEIDLLPVSRTLLSRVMTRFRVWRSHFKRKVAHPQTTEHRVSDTIEAIKIEIDEYIATPTALTTPNFSVRSCIDSGVVDMDLAYDLGGGSRRVTDLQISGLESSMSRGALELEGLPRLRMVDADGVLPTTDLCAPHTQLEDTPSTNSRLTLSPGPVPLTPLDRAVSLRYRPVETDSRWHALPVLHIEPFHGTETMKPVAHPTTAPSIGEWDDALHALATGRIAFGFLQTLPLPDSPAPSTDIGGGIDHGRDADRPRFAPYQVNARRLSMSNEQPDGYAREFHRQLAAASLERKRQTVRVPVGVDLSYIRFRRELKQILTDKGDECIWRGLEMQDDPRL